MLDFLSSGLRFTQNGTYTAVQLQNRSTGNLAHTVPDSETARTHNVDSDNPSKRSQNRPSNLWSPGRLSLGLSPWHSRRETTHLKPGSCLCAKETQAHHLLASRVWRVHAPQGAHNWGRSCSRGGDPEALGAPEVLRRRVEWRRCVRWLLLLFFTVR